MSRPTSRNRGAQVWWLSPVAITVFVAVLSMMPAIAMGDEQFRRLWRSPKSIDTTTFVLFGAGALALAFGALIVSTRSVAQEPKKPWPALSPTSRKILEHASTALTGLTLLGYLGFGVLIVKAGISPSQLLFGTYEGQTVRDTVGTIPGVTTLTQCGMAAVVVSATLLMQRFSRAELVKLLIVVLLALPRAYVFSERLALLELLVPIVVVVSAGASVRPGRARTVTRFVPLVALPVVAAVFSLFEYFRSWTFYRTTSSNGFAEFALERLAGYYATSLNNGHLVLNNLDWPGRLPYDTLGAFWTAPGIEQARLYEVLGHHRSPYLEYNGGNSDFANMLAQKANPEFNNPSGYVGPFIDYGHVGGIVFFFLAGVVAGLLYRAFRAGRPAGLLLYPIVFTGLVELPRYMYWTEGRTTYSWVVLALVLVVLVVGEQKARRVDRALRRDTGNDETQDSDAVADRERADVSV